MTYSTIFLSIAYFGRDLVGQSVVAPVEMHSTKLTIVGDAFHINDKPTYEGKSWKGSKIEGLLFNSRMVQGIFDDLNPESVNRWAYKDTGKWDCDRNTSEFIDAMPDWKRKGLLAFTINLQGGSPEGYSKKQPWINSAFHADGKLRLDYFDRLKKILDRADDLGMVPIVGYFYFGQDQHLRNEDAVTAAVDNATNWLLNGGWENLLVEINNECDVATYDHAILKPNRVAELIDRVKKKQRNGKRLLVGTSFGGGIIPTNQVIASSDFVLLHGNGVSDPARIQSMVDEVRKSPAYQSKPILFNEDDHFDFDKEQNNFIAAIKSYASWGYFDFRMKDEGFNDGFQSVPVDWRSNSSKRKRSFFNLVSEITESNESMRSIDDILLFHPLRYPQGNWQPALEFEDVDFVSKDNTKLHGWYCPSHNSRGTVLLAHGNGGNITHRANWIAYLQKELKLSVFIFDYRGYGRSEGKPTTEGALEDARAARTKLCALAGTTDSEIFLMGESLGGAIAVQLAAESKPRGLILQSTFSSLHEIAKVHFPFFAGLVNKDKLNSVETIKQYDGPLLISHGTADHTIPYNQAEAIYSAANLPKTIVGIPNADHNDWLSEDYVSKLNDFIDFVNSNKK